MKYLKHIDRWVLIIASIIAIILTIIGIFDLFSLNEILKINYSLVSLLLLGLIGSHMVISYILQEDHDNKLTNFFTALQALDARLNVKTFEDSFEMETYLAKRIHEAKNEVCDLSWKINISPGYAVGKRRDSHSVYEKALKEHTNNLLYKEVWMFNDKRRIEKFHKRIKENKAGYSCRYYREIDSHIPRLQFVIIDNNEVIFFASSRNSLLCSIKGEDICKIMKPYFDEIWNYAIPIKEGKLIYKDEVDFIDKNYNL